MKRLRAHWIHWLSCGVCQGFTLFGTGWGLILALCVFAIVKGVIEMI